MCLGHYNAWYYAENRGKKRERQVAKPCSADDCEARATRRGMCDKHYRRSRRVGLPGLPACGVEGCVKPNYGKGLCDNHYRAQYYARNREAREKACEQSARYRAENREKVREQRARYYVENREKVRERDARYRAENREKVRERDARYRAENPEVCRRIKARRRARKAGATVEDFTRAEIFERDGWVCGICDEPIDQSLSYPDPMSASLDHVIPLARGGEHSRANAQAAHLSCNSRKGARVAA